MSWMKPIVAMQATINLTYVVFSKVNMTMAGHCLQNVETNICAWRTFGCFVRYMTWEIIILRGPGLIIYKLTTSHHLKKTHNCPDKSYVFLP